MKSFIFFTFCVFTSFTFAADIALPTPRTEGGMPLFTALANRKSARTFAEKELSNQMISDLLWAAAGKNRADGHRTIPSARNFQEVEAYILIPSGAYRYDHMANKLIQVSDKDLRASSGLPKFSHKAPLTVLTVINSKKLTVKDPTLALKSAAVDSGFMGQNVYLFCAAEGLNTVYLGTLNAKSLAKSLNLAPNDEVLFAQTVGYPSK